MRLILTCILGILLLAGCSDSPEVIKKKLAESMQADLVAIVAQQLLKLDSSELLQDPYYVVDELQFFHGDTANLYAAYAKTSFYFYKNITVKEVRKYRYNAQYHYWDRYEKKLVHYDNNENN